MSGKVGKEEEETTQPYSFITAERCAERRDACREKRDMKLLQWFSIIVVLFICAVSAASTAIITTYINDEKITSLTKEVDLRGPLIRQTQVDIAEIRSDMGYLRQQLDLLSKTIIGNVEK